MKKTSFFCKFGLFCLVLALFSGVSYAGTISLATISADATAAGFNNNFTTIANVINGNIQGSATTGSTTNILADSIGELDMGDEVNPRLRDSELLGIGVDTLSGTTLDQDSFVYTGLTPADSANLTSDISAGTAFINGFRVRKLATSNTYGASLDTYVDLSTTGVYTFSTVAVAAAAPAVAANSARLARVRTDGTEITAVTDLANRRIPGLIVPVNYRNGMVVSRDSATTISVLPGSAEINNTMVSKTSTTTLTITNAGDWAGGTALNAAQTFGFVGLDTSGNLKLHTTAPTHDNFGVSTTVGKRRYATWSSTVYRILGWFFMSGASVIDNASNIKEGDVSNSIQSSDTAIFAHTSTTFSDVQKLNFYSSGGNILICSTVSADTAGGGSEFQTRALRGSTVIAGSGSSSNGSVAGVTHAPSFNFLHTLQPQASTDYTIQARTSTSTNNLRARTLVLVEE